MPKATPEDLNRLFQDLQEDSTLGLNFLVLTGSACIIATIGLLTNSAAVIIGAMIIAPLMMPLRGLALGALEGNLNLFEESLKTLSVGTIFAVTLSCLIARLINLPASEFTPEILARTQPQLGDLGVAVAAGAVSGFAKLRPKITDAVAGTAIAVALMPPLCVVGISLSQGYWTASWGAFLLFFTNLLGITLACMIVFIWGGYYIETQRVKRALRVALALTAILIIPLTLSLLQLIKQAQLQANVKKLLLNRTITVGQKVELTKTNVNWQKNPPEVTLTVLAKEPITPNQVRLVEQFLYREMRQPFKLVFQVSEVREVRANDNQPQQDTGKKSPTPLKRPN